MTERIPVTEMMPAAPAAPMIRDTAAVAAAEAARARIQAAYTMAAHRPRSEDQARARILSACRRPSFASKAEYSKPVGNSNRTGPSIRLAELMLREWNNILVETATVFEDTETRRVRVTCIDLETNASFGREVQISKTVERSSPNGREVVGQRTNSYGKATYTVLATEDEVLQKEWALVSKVIRNEGLRLLPVDIIEEALEAARATRQNKAAKDPKEFRNRILDGFAGIGVEPKHLEAYLGHGLDTVSPAELEQLRAMFQAIQDGDATWYDFLSSKEESDAAAKDQKPPEKPAQPKPQPITKQQLDHLAAKIKAKGVEETYKRDAADIVALIGPHLGPQSLEQIMTGLDQAPMDLTVLEGALRKAQEKKK